MLTSATQTLQGLPVFLPGKEPLPGLMPNLSQILNSINVLFFPFMLLQLRNHRGLIILIVIIILMIKLVNVIGRSMGVVPDELLGFEELAGFKHRFGFVGFDFIGQQGVELMAAEGR